MNNDGYNVITLVLKIFPGYLCWIESAIDWFLVCLMEYKIYSDVVIFLAPKIELYSGDCRLHKTLVSQKKVQINCGGAGLCSLV